MSICFVNGCDRPVKDIGLCVMHSLRWRRHRSFEKQPWGSERQRASMLQASKAAVDARMAVVSEKPKWKCKECGVEKRYLAHLKERPYRKERMYCSRACRWKAEKKVRKPRGTYFPRSVCRKDGNHNEIVGALITLGCSVRDTSAVGNGFPDAVVGFMGMNFLVEIKNPKTQYGKTGLSKLQQEFADEWRGGPVVILWTQDQAAAWVKERRRWILATVAVPSEGV